MTPGDAFAPVDVALSEEIPTVITVQWPAQDGATDASVDFGPDGELRWTAPATLVDGRWEASLVGVKAQTSASLVAAETVDGTRIESEELTITTGSQSSELPSVDLTVDEDGHWNEGFLLGTLVTNPATAILVDPDGDIVWWYSYRPAGSLGRAHLSQDGRGIYMMPINVYRENDNYILKVSLDGSTRERIEVGLGHHDFLELEDGTLAWLSSDYQEVKGETIVGDALTLRAPDGTIRTLWSIWDWRVYDGTEGMPMAGAGGPALAGDGAIEWTHCNSLVYQDGAFLIGSLGLSAIMKVDAATGELLWTFGSQTSDFVSGDGQRLLDNQHQFELLDDSLLVFENGSSQRGASRAVEFSFHEDEPLVKEIWSYWPDPDIYAFSLGNPLRFDNGNTLVNFGAGGQIDEVTHEGEVLWRLSSGLGGAFGYVQQMESLY